MRQSPRTPLNSARAFRRAAPNAPNTANDEFGAFDAFDAFGAAAAHTRERKDCPMPRRPKETRPEAEQARILALLDSLPIGDRTAQLPPPRRVRAKDRSGRVLKLAAR